MMVANQIGQQSQPGLKTSEVLDIPMSRIVPCHLLCNGFVAIHPPRVLDDVHSDGRRCGDTGIHS